jgi:hypothetical protein
MASNDNSGEEADNFDEGFIVAAERDFKRQTRLPIDHFEKLHEATYPHHLYPIKHKLKDCTMIKKFMMSRAPSRDTKLGGDLAGKSAATIPGGSKVMTIFS